MKRLFVVVAGLALLAGCSTSDHQGSGGADINATQGLSGGATGTPSGTTQDLRGAGGEVGAGKAGTANDSSTGR